MFVFTSRIKILLYVLKDLENVTEMGSEGEVNLKYFNYQDVLKNILIGTYREAGIEESEKRKYIRLTRNLVYVKDGERYKTLLSLSPPHQRLSVDSIWLKHFWHQ